MVFHIFLTKTELPTFCAGPIIKNALYICNLIAVFVFGEETQEQRQSSGRTFGEVANLGKFDQF